MKAILRMTKWNSEALIDTTWENANLHTEADGRFFVVSIYHGPRDLRLKQAIWIRAERVQMAWLICDEEAVDGVPQ